VQLQLLLGHRRVESTVRYLGIEIDDGIAEKTETWRNWACAATLPCAPRSSRGDWRDVRAQSIQRRTSNEHLKQCDRQCEGQIPQPRRFLGRRSTLVAGATRTMEKTMIRMAALVLLLALISFAAVAQLTKGRSSTAPGQVGAGTAPDQQQMAPGDAKTFAPGQQ